MIQLIRVVDSSELTSDIKSIYENAFPPDERREWQQTLDLLANPDFSLFGIYNRQELIGMVSIWDLNEFRYIEHFAIRDTERGKGFGSQVIQQIISKTTGQVILEVEIPETETGLKRIEFYERLSFIGCDSEYYQPPYSTGKNKIKMLLMSYPEQISKSDFQSIRKKIYTSVYQVEV